MNKMQITALKKFHSVAKKSPHAILRGVAVRDGRMEMATSYTALILDTTPAGFIDAVYDVPSLLAGVPVFAGTGGIGAFHPKSSILEPSPVESFALPFPSDRMLSCMSSDCTRLSLNGVCAWSVGGAWSGSFATDGRCAMAQGPNVREGIPTGRLDQNTAIIPREFLTLAAAIFGKKDRPSVRVNLTENLCWVLGDGFTLTAKLEGGPYPKWENITPSDDFLPGSFVAPDFAGIFAKFKGLEPVAGSAKMQVSLHDRTFRGHAIPDLTPAHYPETVPDFALDYAAKMWDEGDSIRHGSPEGAMVCWKGDTLRLQMPLRRKVG